MATFVSLRLCISEFICVLLHRGGRRAASQVWQWGTPSLLSSSVFIFVWAGCGVGLPNLATTAQFPMIDLTACVSSEQFSTKLPRTHTHALVLAHTHIHNACAVRRNKCGTVCAYGGAHLAVGAPPTHRACGTSCGDNPTKGASVHGPVL